VGACRGGGGRRVRGGCHLLLDAKRCRWFAQRTNRAREEECGGGWAGGVTCCSTLSAARRTSIFSLDMSATASSRAATAAHVRIAGER
jgi:hypothetical protein